MRALALAQRVHPEFRQHQRLAAGDALEPVEIIGERPRFVEIDVEADEIDGGGLEEFGGREIGERDEPMRVHFLDDASQFVEETLDALGPIPAGDVRGDFVGQREGKHGGVTGNGAGRLAGDMAGKLHAFLVIQETGVLRPVVIHQHFQLVLVGEVQKPSGRRMIDAQAVGVELFQEGEVAFHLLPGWECVAGWIGFKRAVGDAFGVEFLGADAEELAIRQDSFRWECGAGGHWLCLVKK